MGYRREARFSRDSSNLEAVRSALIEAELDDLDGQTIEDIASTYWEEFKPLAVRWFDAKWTDGSEVWMEAEQRGWFDEEYE